MNCNYYFKESSQGYCKIAQELSGGLKCETSSEACAVCITLSNAKSHNSVTASLATSAVKEQAPERLQETIKELRHLYQILDKEKPLESSGPGSQLKSILSWFAVDTPGCKCLDRANKMNNWGPQGCRDNMETILSWLEEEARTRGMPFVKIIAKQLVLLAISRAEACTQKSAT